MKLFRCSLALASVLMCAGCSDLVSLHPFVPDSESIQDARLNGVWMDDDDMYVVRPDGNGYSIINTDKSGKSVYKLKATMLKVGDARILDVTAAGDDSFRIPVHVPIRIWISDTTLRIAFLNTKWLREHAAAELATEALDERTVITSPEDAVTRFLLTYGADDRAFDKPSTLTKQ